MSTPSLNQQPALLVFEEHPATASAEAEFKKLALRNRSRSVNTRPSTSNVVLYNPSAEKETEIRKDLFESILEKQKQIFEVKDKIYQVRYSYKGTVGELKESIKNLFAQLRTLEQELIQLRSESYKVLEQQLKLEKVRDLDIATVKFPDPAKGNLSIMAGRKSEQGAASTTTSSPNSSAAMSTPSWGSVIATWNAAQKWKKTWEKSLSKRAKEFLAETPAQATPSALKEQILHIRKTLYMLKQKKVLSESDAELQEALTIKLKDLDRQFHEKVKGTPEDKEILDQ